MCGRWSSSFAGAGYLAERVAVPFKWYPKGEILAHAAAWRLLDLSESNGRPIDLVIGTKFPSYFVRHPNKVAWLIHQYRAAYELCGTEYSDFDHVEGDVALRATLIELDTAMLSECRRVYTNAANTAARLQEVQRPGGRAAVSSASPGRPAQAGAVRRLRACASVGSRRSSAPTWRSRRWRTSIRPMRIAAGRRGHAAREPRGAGQRLGVADRVRSSAPFGRRALIELYADALAVVYAPFDEDFGYVTLEAFLARKPVITATDSGGPLEFVVDGVNGAIVAPQTRSRWPTAINRYAGGSRRAAASHGERATTRASLVTWDGVIEKLGTGDEAHHPDPVPQRGRDAAGDAARSAAQPAGHRRIEVLVIDDGSRDGTAEVARAHGVQHVVAVPAAQGAGRRVHAPASTRR